MGSDVSKSYRQELIERTGLDFPEFHKGATHLAPFLALLQDPGKSGAVGTRVTCINNPDPTSARQRCIIVGQVGLDPNDIVFWNFHAAFGRGEPDHPVVNWATEVERLIDVMPALRAVLAFGYPTWKGMRDVHLRKGVMLIGAPHPSNRGVLPDVKASEAKIAGAWRRAKELLD